jgi:hypothetical protein
MNLGSKCPTGGGVRWLVCALAVVGACACAGTAEHPGVPTVDLPGQARNAKLYASERGFGVVVAFQGIQRASALLYVYNVKLGLIRIVRRGDGLVARPTAHFLSEQEFKTLPQCAATAEGKLVRVAFQKWLNFGVQIHTGSLKLGAGPSAAVQDETTVVGVSDVSTPQSLSFVCDCDTGAWRGVAGVDSNSVLWVSLRGAGGAKAGKKRDVWRWIARGFAPQAALDGTKTLLLFYVERKRGGPISLLRCEREEGQWEKREHLRVFPGPARRMALAARGGVLRLLVGGSAQGRYQFHLLVSTDKGTTWRRSRRAHAALSGTLTDIALAHDGASMAGILEDAKGEATVFVLPLEKGAAPGGAGEAKGDVGQEWKAEDRDREAAETKARREAAAKARAKKLEELMARDRERRRRYEEWKRRREADKAAQEKPEQVTPQPDPPSPKPEQDGPTASSAKGETDADED